ncbi:uncharacterized protein PFL1_06292 [Pseudozyma flocculosa PF-1]|uniref:Uncharacterized protein n=2 Tax=Pseudozyma flocculosa TaxID=84751 RepID=A0A5C3FAK8_9BASI|nr:uncharacterized protein PFL1_06292 [Pseudozyma flocculosa PF-1]EPQ26084.1 hypothetical protein PFL1_06292 [Pseudozyma flocculosa PF-1]SPO40329.1 uncharacterized protein PSFLO_05811 [Pseudozyma flocculosa]
MPLILPESTNLPTVVNDTADVSHDALRALSPDTIVHEIKRLQDSVARLRDSNHQIQQFVTNDPDAADLSTHDRQQLHTACHDNLGTISKQQGLIERLVGVLSEQRGDPRAAAHYAAQAPAQQAASTQPATDPPQTESQPEAPAASGVYL